MADRDAILLLLENVSQDLRAMVVKVDSNRRAIAELQSENKTGTVWGRIVDKWLPVIITAILAGSGGAVASQMTKPTMEAQGGRNDNKRTHRNYRQADGVAPNNAAGPAGIATPAVRPAITP